MLLLYLACDNWKYLGGDWRTIFWISKNTRTKDKSQKKTKDKYIKQNTKKTKFKTRHNRWAILPKPGN